MTTAIEEPVSAITKNNGDFASLDKLPPESDPAALEDEEVRGRRVVGYMCM